MTYGHTLAKNPFPRGHEIYNFGRPFLGHLTCILTLSVLCLGEEKIFKEIVHFHYITFIDMTRHKSPYPGVMKITILVDTSSGILTLYLVCLLYAWN